ncbi:MAG: AraC family transcriptional regulator [candidate division WOR-3 bacterium]
MITEDWARKALISFFKKKPDITIKKVVNDNNLSMSDFYNKWQFNLSPKKFLIFFRLAKALKLLSCDHKKVRDVADELKFCDHFYFCKWFKKLTGITPKRFQIKYALYFRKGLYQKIKLKNFDIKNIFWVLKILEND